MISITILKEIVEEILYLSHANKTCVSVYLFGSSISKNNPADIDILYLYNHKSAPICYKHAIKFRHLLYKEILSKFNIPADVILLSLTEEQELCYLKKISHIKLH